MSDTPWLTIIGIGEDGVAGLGAASQAALAQAEVIMAPSRHLAMVQPGAARRIAWPVPFADGLAVLKGLRRPQGQQEQPDPRGQRDPRGQPDSQGQPDLTGQPDLPDKSSPRVVVLASGDPFWFGAGRVIAQHFAAGEWTALPAVSCFALAASRMGWALDRTTCVGLHAAPFTRLRRDLAPGVQIIATVRNGSAVTELANYLTSQNFGQSTLAVMEHLGGSAEQITSGTADTLSGDFEHPVCIAILVAGDGAALPRATGLPDDTFQHDGQITKRPVRAITLSTLAPLPGEHLWDIGGGSGSVGLEWLLAHPTTTATTVEPRHDRANRIRDNADALGVAQRLTVIEGTAPAALAGLSPPDAIFIGGGLTEDLLDAVTAPLTARIVVNAVTLEGEALLSRYHGLLGGDLMRIEVSNATPLGSKRGWSASYPVVQWSVKP